MGSRKIGLLIESSISFNWEFVTFWSSFAYFVAFHEIVIIVKVQVQVN